MKLKGAINLMIVKLDFLVIKLHAESCDNGSTPDA